MAAKRGSAGIPIRFGAAIRTARLKAGLSQEGLAHRAGLDRTYVGGVERGERNIALINIDRLAKALGVPVSSLFASPDE